MPVTIHSTIPSRLFQGIGQVYLSGRMIALVNAEGGTLIEGTGPDIAPTITRAPSILPQGAAIGDSITLDIGAAEGAPQPAPSWDITLNGDSIRDQLDAGALTLELTQPGYYELTVSWANSVGIIEAETAALTVEALPDAPAIDYDTQALAYFDADTAFAGTAADVTSISMRGTGGYVLSKTGSGAAIQHGAEGFTFDSGAYLQSANLSNQPTTDGLFVVVEATLTAYGTGVGQLVDGSGGRIRLMDNAGALSAIGVDDSNASLALGSVPYGTRVVIAGGMDDVLDVVNGINVAGAALSTAHGGLTDPGLTRVLAGRYVRGTIHRLALIARAEGTDWPVSMEDVYADFQAGA